MNAHSNVDDGVAVSAPSFISDVTAAGGLNNIGWYPSRN